MRSPSGRTVVPPEGPADAELLLIGESPAIREVEKGRPFVGRAGRVLDQCLNAAGLDRRRIRIINCVPVRPDGDRFANHTTDDRLWGRDLFYEEVQRAVDAGVKVIMPLGNNPLSWVVPQLPQPPSWSDEEAKAREKSRIGAWRGSVFPLGNQMNTIEVYEDACFGLVRQTVPLVLPSYHPSALARQLAWHPWGIIDFKRAKALLDGTYKWPKSRQWYVNELAELDRFVQHIIDVEHVVAIDTEQSPYWIVALVGETEVHTFEWNEAARPALERLLSSPNVLKVAHNLAHDWTFFKVALGLDVALPFADTGGLGHILDCSLARNLSPALSTRFTSWPYHKWMVDEDPKRYCGYDTIVAYDGYWTALENICRRGLLKVANHDHALLASLLRMQWRGIRVDASRRQAAEGHLDTEYKAAVAAFREMAEPIVRERLKYFEKPHLFYQERKCDCCGGGAVQRVHCWRCAGLVAPVERKADYWPLYRRTMLDAGALEDGVNLAEEFKHLRVAALREMLPDCVACNATGRVGQWQEINPDSPDQLADILYRGLRIRARRYKGSVTVRADQLAPLADQYPVVAQAINMSKIGADLDTVRRLVPDLDGRLHGTFDPWGTPSGRVASREGLLQQGTNLQNIPKKHRYILVPDHGKLMVAPDMAQIEGRCIAIVSGDQGLRDAYTKPIEWPGHPRHGTIDSHTFVQQMVKRQGVDLSRDQCKRMTYAAIYGASAAQLTTELNAEAARRGGGFISVAQMTKALSAFFRVFLGVLKWQERTVDQVLHTRRLVSPTERVRTWLGYMTRTVRQPGPGDVVLRVALRRGKRVYVVLDEDIKKAAWSTQPQDMAAWVLALGLRRVEETAQGLAEPLVHVHDELVIQIPGSPGRLVDEALALIVAAMTVTEWGMEFPADVGEPAPNWACAKDEHRDAGDGRCEDCARLLKAA